MIITSSGDCFFPSATSQIGLVSCPSHTSPGCLSCREHKPVGDQLSSDPKMWPAAREEARPSLGGSHCLMGVQEHRGCGLGGWEGISGAQPEHPRWHKDVSYLQWYQDSKNQPQRKVKRHIRETINTKETFLLFQNIKQTHTQKQTKAVTKTQSKQKCKKCLHLYMCKSNYLHEIKEVFTGIKRSVLPLSRVFTPKNVYGSKESFLSFNKLDTFPSCLRIW